MTKKARNNFWSIEGNHFHRHHVEFSLICRQKKHSKKTQTTLDVLQESRIDDYWKFWSSVSQAAQRKEKQWAIEKPKLDNARKLRGIYFIDPDDNEFKYTNKKKERGKVGNSNGSRYAL